MMISCIEISLFLYRKFPQSRAAFDEPPPDDEPDLTPKHSAHHPVVVSKHESCADGISKGADLLLPKHELQEVGFPWKFQEVGGRRSAVVSGRRSASTSAGGQISLEISGIVFSFEGSDFQKNV